MLPSRDTGLLLILDILTAVMIHVDLEAEADL